ncbi:thioesterase II family protein [Pseudoduganella violacea]|uniref:Medium-chain acyl-[acyl-carrier-protein] hydrolase n=1 Tax=Pseudoduganella violacea TaxID=1715466 RepID=A0A7W5BEP6_9BURK|nr:alpha/beta fold hydrolase [Pseudoduganella violacea]MBB3121812.1 medium-chain acyl-[acyl-carrier-protein] hydrolase [Pseudoduganella violacea]
MRLLCFPHAGAGPSQFRSWLAAGPDRLQITPVALPGREARYKDAAPRRLDALLHDVSRHIEPLLDQPFAMMGHSMGALLAFELARLLRRAGRRQPERLFVSAFRAPHLGGRWPPLHALPAPLLKAELLRLDGTPPGVLVQPDLMDTLLPVLRSDLEIAEHYRYQPEPPLACPITCLGGIADERISRPELRGWQQHTTAEFRLRLFPGGHFYLYKTPVLVQHAICADLGLSTLRPNEAMN